jgi:hypothetical protein
VSSSSSNSRNRLWHSATARCSSSSSSSSRTAAEACYYPCSVTHEQCWAVPTTTQCNGRLQSSSK